MSTRPVGAKRLGLLPPYLFAEIERKIAALSDMRDTLKGLVHACAGDHRPNCPILKELSDGA